MKMNWKKKRIVVADDDEDILASIKETLDNVYTVFTALDGREAVEIVKKIKPDLVILDVLMPDMDGFEACRMIKKDKLLTHIPVIFLTAKNQVEDTERGFQSGADSYMVKPFSPLKLLEKIGGMIDRAEMREGLE